MSDPSTKDLIAAARAVAFPMDCDQDDECPACLLFALADRLEELEEERGRRAFQNTADLLEAHVEVLPDSPEPSDLEPGRWEPFPSDEDLAAIIGEDHDADHQPTPWEDSDGHDLANHIGALAVLAGGQSKKAVADIRDRALALYARIRREARLDTDDVPERAESVDPEPEDDPWAYVERYAATALRTPLRTPFIDALLDLRKRVGDLTQIARDTHTRLNALEGHADRGSEAEAELRGRVTRLEALDRATTTVHDNMIEELLGRVETLEREQERREDYEMEQREREE